MNTALKQDSYKCCAKEMCIRNFDDHQDTEAYFASVTVMNEDIAFMVITYSLFQVIH